MHVLLMSPTPPLINYDFTKGLLPYGSAFTRSTTGTYTDRDGVIQTAGINEPRFTHEPVTGAALGLLYEGQSTNYNRNSVIAGGTVGTSTLPTYWSTYTSSTGLSRILVAKGTEHGMPYADFRLHGTPDSAGAYKLFLDNSTSISAVLGDDVAASAFVKLVGGSTTNITAFKYGMDYQNGGSYTGFSGTEFTPQTYIQRVSDLAVVDGATTDNVKPSLSIAYGADPIDVTLRIYHPQVEKAAFVSSPISTTSAAVTRATDQLSFTIPAGVVGLRYLFDDYSTQDVAVDAGEYTVPTDLDRSIIKKIPSFVVSPEIDYLMTSSLDTDLTFTRSSDGTYFDADGVMQTAVDDAPRFDHDPVTGEALGLLMEGQKSNNAKYSSEFSNAYWGLSGLLAFGSGSIEDATTAPDGTETADKICENTATSTHALSVSSVGISPSTTQTFSIFVKPAGRNYLSIRMQNRDNGFHSIYASFDLLTLAKTTSTGGSGSVVSSSIEPVGNGFFRVSITGAPNNGTAATKVSVYVNDEYERGNTTYEGDGTSGLYIWGAQAETGSLSSYIPTSVTTATRAADTLINDDISDWFNDAEGTLFVDVDTETPSSAVLAEFSDNTWDERIKLGEITSATNISHTLYVGGSSLGSLTTTRTGTTDSENKIAISWKVGSFQVIRNNAGYASNTPAVMPTVSQLMIGAAGPSSQFPINGHIKRLKYWNVALTNTQLEEETS